MSLKLLYQLLLVLAAVFAFGDAFNALRRFAFLHLLPLAIAALAVAALVQSCVSS